MRKIKRKGKKKVIRTYQRRGHSLQYQGLIRFWVISAPMSQLNVTQCQFTGYTVEKFQTSAPSTLLALSWWVRRLMNPAHFRRRGTAWGLELIINFQYKFLTAVGGSNQNRIRSSVLLKDFTFSFPIVFGGGKESHLLKNVTISRINILIL